MTNIRLKSLAPFPIPEHEVLFVEDPVSVKPDLIGCLLLVLYLADGTSREIRSDKRDKRNLRIR